MKYPVAVAALSSVATAAVLAPVVVHAQEAPQTAWQASRRIDDNDMVTTGVARGRDRLDSATSTSAIKESEIIKIGSRSLPDLLRNVPGLRVEAGSDVNASYTVRGLPLVSTGAKYLQLQEDGLPVLEFGDFLGLTPDLFLRADLNLSQVEAIRGGSASTFASNAPGGVINLMSKTGEVEGGSVQASTGLNYGTYRTDFDYGGHLSDTLRFHVGGFYREGEGARHVGFDAYRGGQLKFNLTKTFTGGYIRFYAKLLDDRVPGNSGMPTLVTGTDANPHYSDLPGFSGRADSTLSRYMQFVPGVDNDNNPTQMSLREGMHSKAKTLGLEAQFAVADWSVTERLRYSGIAGNFTSLSSTGTIPAAFAPFAFGGSSLRYFNGPLAGQAIADPANLNGNGLVLTGFISGFRVRSLDNLTNDLRISRVWDVQGGDLTTTFGLYKSYQDLNYDFMQVITLQDVVGGGNSALLDVVSGGSTASSDGVLFYGVPGGGYKRSYDVRYGVTAPYGSFNFHKGKIAVGGSIRYDAGKVEGTIRSDQASDVRAIDVNGDGVITGPEGAVQVAPISRNQPVNYTYNYLSYSAGINFRVSEPFAVFARYSRGARAGADHLLFSTAIDSHNGKLLNKTAAYDPVRQAEVGLKFRKAGLTFNLTGFYARTTETNTQLNTDSSGALQLQLVTRSYRAYGAEIEGGIRRGPFSLNLGATLANARITGAEDASLIGHTPRHQAALIFQATPQYDTDLFTVGANVIGTTSSYTQDVNQLKMPAYTTVALFAQLRPIERVELSLNASNIFNTRAITDVANATIPAGGVAFAQTLYGRTISTSARFFF